MPPRMAVFTRFSLDTFSMARSTTTFNTIELDYPSPDPSVLGLRSITEDGKVQSQDGPSISGIARSSKTMESIWRTRFLGKYLKNEILLNSQSYCKRANTATSIDLCEVVRFSSNIQL